MYFCFLVSNTLQDTNNNCNTNEKNSSKDLTQKLKKQKTKAIRHSFIKVHGYPHTYTHMYVAFN